MENVIENSTSSVFNDINLTSHPVCSNIVPENSIPGVYYDSDHKHFVNTLNCSIDSPVTSIATDNSTGLLSSSYVNMLSECINTSSDSTSVGSGEYTNGPLSILKCLKLNNPNGIIIGHLNITSLRNMFDEFNVLVKMHVDIVAITETKLDDTFTTNQFLIDGFLPPHTDLIATNMGEILIEGFLPPYRSDRNKYGEVLIEGSLPSIQI